MQELLTKFMVQMLVLYGLSCGRSQMMDTKVDQHRRIASSARVRTNTIRVSAVSGML